MPYKIDYEHKYIPRHLDRRVKLSIVERAEIKKLYGKISQRKLAKKFDVSRRLIVFIGCPEKYKKNLMARAKSGGSKQYYDRIKHNKSMQKTRMYRKRLNNEKKLVGEKDDREIL